MVKTVGRGLQPLSEYVGVQGLNPLGITKNANVTLLALRRLIMLQTGTH